MEWVILSFLRALFMSGKETTAKLSMLRPSPSYTIAAFYMSVISCLILTPLILWDGTWRFIFNDTFMLAVAGNVFLNTIGHLLLLKTIRKFDISYVSAVLATSPLIFGVFSIVFLGEFPGLIAFFAMGVIVIGGILVEMSRGKFTDLKSLFMHSGWPVLTVYLCLAAGATVFSKIAVTTGDPEAYIAIRYACLSVVFIVIHFIYESQFGSKVLKRDRAPISLHFDPKAALSGLFVLGSVICEMNALRLIDMASVEAITKFAIIATLIIDAAFISKKITWQRWAGSGLIFVGGIGVIVF